MRDRRLDRLFDRFRRRGDVRALGEVFDRTAPELLRVATSLERDLGEAEDLLQATFLTAIERAERYDANRRLVPWLLGILVNHAHEARRRRAREMDPERLERRAASDPREEAEAVELSEALEAALARLSARDRRVLEPYLREGRPAVEIARAQGIAPGTVRMQIHRSLDRLRKALPAGIAIGAAVTSLGGRGLAAVRAEVLRQGTVASTGLAVGGAGAVSATSILGGLTVTKKLVLAATVVALVAGVSWMALPVFRAEPGASAPEIAEARSSEIPRSEVEEVAPPPPPEGLRSTANGQEGRTGPVLDPWQRALAGVRGRLVESDGAPVADVEVTLLELRASLLSTDLASVLRDGPQDPNLFAGTATTDGEGLFQLRGARARGAMHALGIDLGGQRGGLWLLGGTLQPGESTDLGDVVLAPTGSIRGRVVDSEGQGLAGVRVRAGALHPAVPMLDLGSVRADSSVMVVQGRDRIVLEPPAWFARYEKKLPIPTTRTGGRGELRLDHVPAGTPIVLIDAPGFATRVVPELRLGPGNEHDLGALPLERGASVQGRVVDKGGQAVSGAEVVIGEQTPLGLTVLQPAGSTDAEGRFSLGGFDPSAEVVATARRRPEHAWTIVTAARTPEGIEIVVPAEGALVVRVRTIEGEPISGAELFVYPAEDLPNTAVLGQLTFHRLDATTDPSKPGQYHLEGIPRGDYTVIATAAGYASNLVEVHIRGPEKEVELVLPPGRDVEVVVLDDASGDPVSRAEIAASLREARGAALATGVSDERGLCRLSGVVDESTLGTSSRLRIEHPAYPTTFADLASGKVRQVVRLRPGGELRAQALAGLRRARGSFLMSFACRGPDDDLPSLASSDEQGRFRIARLTPGRYGYGIFELVAGDGDLLGMLAREAFPSRVASGDFEIVEGEVTELEIPLYEDMPGLADALGEPGGRVSGRILLNGRPAVGFSLAIGNERGMTARRFQATPDAEGRFQIEGVPQGAFFLGVYRMVGDGKARVYRSEHEMEDVGAGVHLEFDWSSTSVDVRVHDASGEPVPGALVTLVPEEVAQRNLVTWMWADTQGRARLETLATGRFTLHAWHEEHGVGENELDLAGSLTSLTSTSAAVTLWGAIRVAGTVALVDGLTTANGTATLCLRPVDHPELATWHSITFIGERATFEVNGALPGRTQTTLWTREHYVHGPDVDIPPAGMSDLRLEFAPPSDG